MKINRAALTRILIIIIDSSEFRF